MNVKIIKTKIYWTVLNKAFWRLCRVFWLEDSHIQKILELDDENFKTINKNKTLPHTEKNQAIVEKLLKIYYNLQFYYGNRRDIMSSYFHIKRQYFNNKTLIEYITEDSLINFKLECILQYLKFNIWK